MKRFLSLILTLCLVLSLLSGLSLYVAAAEIDSAAITGIVEPVAGGNVVTTGVTGVPDGFDVTVEWLQYNYSNQNFDIYEKDTFEDNAVYRLDITFEAEEGNWASSDYDKENCTINGATVDEFFTLEKNENGFTEFGFSNFYYVGNITVLDQMTIAQLPAPQAGTSTAAGEVKVPDGSPYYVGDVSWTEASQWETFEGATLEANGQYVLFVKVYPQEGYFFHYDTEVSAPMELRSGYFQDAHGYMSSSFYYDLRPHVDIVNVLGDFDFAYGDSAADFTFSAPANANYTIESLGFARWDDSTGWQENFTGKFICEEYRLCLKVTPKGDYLLDSPEIQSNGAPLEGNWDLDYEENFLILEYRFALEPEKGYVKDLEISGAPDDIAAGAEIKTPTLKLEQGAAAITKTQWVDAEYKPVSGKFADGKVYYLAVTVKPNEGYAIRNGYGVDVETVEGDYKRPYASRNDDGTSVVNIRYSLVPKIDKVEIQVDKAVIGAAPVQPKVPADAKYSIVGTYWRDSVSNDEFAKYEDGHKYYLDVQLIPANGYEFADDLEITVNGEEPYYGGSDSESCSVGYKVSFMEQIHKVELPAAPEVKLGDKLESFDVTLPTGAKYEVHTQWIKSTNNGGGEDYEGPAQDKSVYYLLYYIYPADGYEFAEDVELTVGGKKVTTGLLITDDSWIDYGKMYSFGMQVIKTVELTAEKPEVGKTYGKITAPANANYTIDSSSWGKSDKDDLFDTKNMKKTETFKAGKYYWIEADLVAKEGYVFAEDLKVTVNGKEVDMAKMQEKIGNPTVVGGYATVIQNLGKLADPSNPDTGDDMQLGLCMVLAVISAAGLGITATKKKYF